MENSFTIPEEIPSEFENTTKRNKLQTIFFVKQSLSNSFLKYSNSKKFSSGELGKQKLLIQSNQKVLSNKDLTYNSMKSSIKLKHLENDRSKMNILRTKNMASPSSKEQKMSITSALGYLNLNLYSKKPNCDPSNSSKGKSIILEEDKIRKGVESFYVSEESFSAEMLATFYQYSFLERNEYFKSLILSQPKIQIGLRPNVKSNKTIVINLEETLVTDFSFNPEDKISVDETAIRKCYLKNQKCVENEINFAIRPFILEFLRTISKIYEVIVFSNTSKERSKAILNNLDPEKELYHALLSKSDCLKIGDMLIKNVTKIDRSIENIVIIDNNMLSFFNCLRNGIYLPAFEGSIYDTYFSTLTTFLYSIKDEIDVREYIYKSFHVEDYWNKYKILYNDDLMKKFYIMQAQKN